MECAPTVPAFRQVGVPPGRQGWMLIMATGLTISIGHCSEQEFLESLRRDLCDAQETVEYVKGC